MPPGQKPDALAGQLGLQRRVVRVGQGRRLFIGDAPQVDVALFSQEVYAVQKLILGDAVILQDALHTRQLVVLQPEDVHRPQHLAVVVDKAARPQRALFEITHPSYPLSFPAIYP